MFSQFCIFFCRFAQYSLSKISLLCRGESDTVPANKTCRRVSSEQRPRTRSCHDWERLFQALFRSTVHLLSSALPTQFAQQAIKASVSTAEFFVEFRGWKCHMHFGVSHLIWRVLCHGSVELVWPKYSELKQIEASKKNSFSKKSFLNPQTAHNLCLSWAVR